MIGSRSQSRAGNRIVTLCVFSIIVFGMSACGDDNEMSNKNFQAVKNTHALASILRELSKGVDYEPHKSPRELAERAELTVVGEVISVDEGRVFGIGPTREAEPVFLNVAITVKVDRVLAGNEALVQKGLVFVEIARTKAISINSLRNATPTKQRVILFLGDYSEGMVTFPVIEKAQSIPDGATVFAPYADGFILEDQTSGTLVGGLDSFERMAPAWRKGTVSVDTFIEEHFPSVQ